MLLLEKVSVDALNVKAALSVRVPPVFTVLLEPLEVTESAIDNVP